MQDAFRLEIDYDVFKIRDRNPVLVSPLPLDLACVRTDVNGPLKLQIIAGRQDAPHYYHPHGAHPYDQIPERPTRPTACKPKTITLRDTVLKAFALGATYLREYRMGYSISTHRKRAE